MSYQFDVSYPVENGQGLHQIQEDILRRFPTCYRGEETPGPKYHSIIYYTDQAQEIARLANTLRQADTRFFVAFVNYDGKYIYYHPIELAALNPAAIQQYVQVMEHLSQTERSLHDYLVNLYHSVPTHVEFNL
ncbi:hypothetical protein LCGC14_2626920 [marine sediment metagenome]|uniref:Uncharacterized protein n=1 Tax=marine sediment metagenome TaxID=412755 RepID=A0A0F9CCG9_9ZZZZ